MDRSPAFLAALASAAVPGLDPVSVEALPSTDDQSFDVAFVQDAEHRRWVVRAPRSDVAGAEMDRSVSLLALLGRRLPFAVPAPKGFVALTEGGRAAVYPYLPGHNLDFAELPAGPGVAAELGRAIAALHNTDPAVYEEAGLPSYDADAYRSRRLADLDRAAETGRVPTTLLTRWETALEDVTLWRFAPTATHGDLTGDQVLAVFTDDEDATTGKIRAVTGWEDAKVADPADDFAALVADAPPEALETVLEAYSHTRVERPDPNLLVRARLVAELGLLSTMMVALARKNVGAVEVLTTQLRRLDDAVHASEEPDDYRRTSLAPVGLRRRTARPPALVVDDEDEDLPEIAGETDDADAADVTHEAGAADVTDGVEGTDDADAADVTDDVDAANVTDDVDAANVTDEAGAADATDEADGADATDDAGAAHVTDDAGAAHVTDDAGAAEATDAPGTEPPATVRDEVPVWFELEHPEDDPPDGEADQVTTEIDLRSGERPSAPQ